MGRVAIVDNAHITLWVDPGIGLIHHVMRHACFGAPLREALTLGVEAMREYSATLWLADNRIHSAVSEEDEAWIKQLWFPKAVNAGWTHWALVDAELVTGQLNMRRFTRHAANRGVTVRIFDSPTLALAWLESLGSAPMART